jgi:hypothetical protein
MGINQINISKYFIQGNQTADNREHLSGGKCSYNPFIPFKVETGQCITGNNCHKGCQQRGGTGYNKVVLIIGKEIIIHSKQIDITLESRIPHNKGRREFVRLHIGLKGRQQYPQKGEQQKDENYN